MSKNIILRAGDGRYFINGSVHSFWPCKSKKDTNYVNLCDINNIMDDEIFFIAKRKYEKEK